MLGQWIARAVLAGGLAVAAAPAPAAPAWEVDPAASRLAFSVRQGTQTIEGGFARWNAAIRFDPADLAGSGVEVTVDLSSLATGDPERDRQTRAPELFDLARFPEARYRTLAFRPRGGDTYEVEAELTLKGVTRPLTHPVTITIEGERATARGEVVLDRRAFGFGTGPLESEQILGGQIQVRFEVRARRS